ncbi:MAG TPA: hypothetical protein VLG28_05340 [Acidimicrobiia bacterium]|nr:hypothetical protein [Acidimicrobiia bacterium]
MSEKGMVMPHRSLSRLLALSFVIGLVVTTAPVAGAAGHSETLYEWTELTEGVTVDNDGNIFVSNSFAGELWKIAPGAAGPEVLATIDGINPAAGDLGMLGLAADSDGNIYAAVNAPNGPRAHGVWKIDGDTGDAMRIRGSRHIEFPNSVALDARGTLYVTDTVLGAVWKMGRRGMEAWAVDPLMLGTGSLGLGNPIGANGLAIVGRNVYVSVTEQASIVEIPINPDGSAGAAGIFAADGALFAVDGIAAAADGSIFAGIIGQFSIVRVLTDGTVAPVASAAAGDEGVLDVSSVAFGTTPDTRRTLYGVNFGFLSQADFGADPRPALVAVDTGVPGQPIP